MGNSDYTSLSNKKTYTGLLKWLEAQVCKILDKFKNGIVPPPIQFIVGNIDAPSDLDTVYTNNLIGQYINEGFDVYPYKNGFGYLHENVHFNLINNNNTIQVVDPFFNGEPYTIFFFPKKS